MRINPTFNEYNSRLIKGLSIDLGGIKPATLIKLVWAEKVKSLSEQEKKRLIKLSDPVR